MSCSLPGVWVAETCTGGSLLPWTGRLAPPPPWLGAPPPTARPGDLPGRTVWMLTSPLALLRRKRLEFSSRNGEPSTPGRGRQHLGDRAGHGPGDPEARRKERPSIAQRLVDVSAGRRPPVPLAVGQGLLHPDAAVGSPRVTPRGGVPCLWCPLAWGRAVGAPRPSKEVLVHRDCGSRSPSSCHTNPMTPVATQGSVA